MFVRHKDDGKIFSANQIEGTVALVPIDSFVHPHVSLTFFVTADELCEHYLRVNPAEVRETYRKLKAEA